ncbi:uncharacterized protein LOC110857211 [Folsomia candida]|nr:uncharacterized protein LOC110857211 [Folsomia candida]
MKLRSSSSLEKTIVISKALRNPLILNLIFAKLNTTNLRTARLVCREWGDVGAGLLGKRTALNVNKLFRYDGTKLYLQTHVAENFMRRISISDRFYPSVPIEKMANVITKVFTDLAHVFQVTREIYFRVSQRETATAFVNGLRKLNKTTTNIQKISVSVYWKQPISHGRGVYSAYTKKLPILTNLTSIEFSICWDILRENFDVHGFQPLLQALMDSAPNLNSLDVSSNFFPNFEGCKNLKVLNFRLIRQAPYKVPNRDLVAAIGMLAQVKDTLIEMGLSSHVSGDVMPRKWQSLDVPVMSKLTSLSIHPTAIYMCQDFLNENHLPALKDLFLGFSNRSAALIASPHLNLWKRHSGVKSLKLELDGRWLKNANGIGLQIVRLFPSVKKLEVGMAWKDVINNKYLEVNKEEVKQIMTPYRNWDLEEASVRFDGVNASSVLMTVLENMTTWRGVKSANFRYAGITQDDFSASIEDLILHSRGFKSVKIGSCRRDVVPEILEVIQPILAASGAPIQVTGVVVRS